MAIILGAGKELFIGSEHYVCVIRPVASVVKVSGITKDATGAALGSCVVDLYRTTNDVFVKRTTSDATGAYAFDVAGTDGPFYVVAYKAGAPDVAGTSVNTLVGT